MVTKPYSHLASATGASRGSPATRRFTLTATSGLASHRRERQLSAAARNGSEVTPSAWWVVRAVSRQGGAQSEGELRGTSRQVGRRRRGPKCPPRGSCDQHYAEHGFGCGRVWVRG
eukprot:13279681-Alexandrium_andersonii.AAC.1